MDIELSKGMAAILKSAHEYRAAWVDARDAFNAYARHLPDCGGGDGEKCQCGFLDEWSKLNALING